MKSIVIVLSLMIFSITMYAGDPAPIGKNLGKIYPVIGNNEPTVVLIYLKDKGAHQRNIMDAPILLSKESIARRLRFRPPENVIDESDYPLERSYVQAIAGQVINVRNELKWFNAVSVTATKTQIEALRLLPFVKEIDLVNRWKKTQNETIQPLVKSSEAPPQPKGVATLNYGASFAQDNLEKIPAVHDLGIYGQGVTICMMDNGVRNPYHQVFDSMHIIATHDFVDHKTSVIPNDANTGFGSHGVWTLSIIGGYRPGSLIGPAFRSNFLLARTENDSSETPIEEDNWVAALQWADSIGVDVTSTSLGYLGFDAPYTSLTAADMNGHTAIISIAAAHGAALGIVVVNAAGNDGNSNGVTNTLIAPADADSIITAGAVDVNGNLAGFSSGGPTTDNPSRIKPDVVAVGVGNEVASSTDTVSYGYGSGTSFACPLTAGVAALIRSANPSLTPLQVQKAIKQTANNVASPNNLYGWGVVNADSALKYFGVTSLGLGSVSGTAFNDLNGNGVKDAGEPSLSGIRIRLSGVVTDSTLTDGSGNFTFSNLPIDTYYSLSQQPQGGWVSSTGSKTILLIHPSDTTAINFGSFQNGIISGHVYNDVNKNGIFDAGDSVLALWTVRLSGPAPQSVLTDSTGWYAFSNLSPGIYTVSESAQANWFQSYPPGNGSYSVTMRSGLDSSGLVFLNYYDAQFNYPVVAGWNLLSLPQIPASHLKTDLYPSAKSQAFIYNHEYKIIDTIPNGIGYWLKFANSQNILILGTERTADTISVVTGWNMIGSLSAPFAVSSIGQNPTGNISSNYFQYNSAYSVADSLRPHTGYWVKAKNPGQLYVNSSGGHALPLAAQTTNPAQLNQITFIDAGKRQQTLYFTQDSSLNNERDRYELPPLPPDGGFDARFSNGSLLNIASGIEDAQILISSGIFPMSLKWKIVDAEGSALQIDGKEIALHGNGSATLAQAADIRLAPSSASGKLIPKTFALEQNYPNPFNPSTTLTIDLSDPGFVSLKIYDVLGREIRTLVNGTKAAGVYTMRWNANDAPSGLYFARMTVTNASGKQVYTATQKFVLMK